MPETCQRLRLVFQSIRFRSMQCGFTSSQQDDKIIVLYDNKIQAYEAACSYTEHKNHGKITCSRFQDVRQFQMTITYGNCSNFSNLNMYQNLFFNVFKGHRGPTPNQDLGYLIIPYDGTIALGRIFFLIQTNAQYERSKLVLLFQ